MRLIADCGRIVAAIDAKLHAPTKGEDMNIPGGKSTVTPYVAVRNASGFLDFVTRVFGAAEVGRVSNPDGSIGHAETVIGNSVIMVFDAPKSWPETPAFLSVYVENADETVARAIDAGGALITQVATSGIVGDHGGRVKDPQGNIWWIQTHLEDIDEATMMERFADPTELAIMEDAQRTLDSEMRSRTQQGCIRAGD
jgi:uncharacterized glyoxalase superfamily protein PhnB